MVKLNTLLFLFILGAFPTFAQKKKILHCLGQEEAKVHLSKDGSIRYELNQLAIHLLLGLDLPELSGGLENKICKSKESSQTFFEELFSKGDQFFSSSSKKMSGFKANFEELFLHSFNTILGLYQKKSPTADCLNQKIKPLPKLQQQLYYNSDIISPYNSIMEDKTGYQIIKKLFRESEDLFSLCRQG